MHDFRDVKGSVESVAGYEGILPRTTPGSGGEKAKRQRDQCDGHRLGNSSLRTVVD